MRWCKRPEALPERVQLLLHRQEHAEGRTHADEAIRLEQEGRSVVAEYVEHYDAAQRMADDCHATPSLAKRGCCAQCCKYLQQTMSHVTNQQATAARRGALMVQLVCAIPQHARVKGPRRVVKYVQHSCTEEGPVTRQGGQRAQGNLVT